MKLTVHWSRRPTVETDEDDLILMSAEHRITLEQMGHEQIIELGHQIVRAGQRAAALAELAEPMVFEQPGAAS